MTRMLLHWGISKTQFIECIIWVARSKFCVNITYQNQPPERRSPSAAIRRRMLRRKIRVGSKSSDEFRIPLHVVIVVFRTACTRCNCSRVLALSYMLTYSMGTGTVIGSGLKKFRFDRVKWMTLYPSSWLEIYGEKS